VRHLNDVALTPNQREVLAELRRRLSVEFEIEGVVLFGSAARGEADEESDLDLLILTKKPLTRPVRHQITDLIFEVNLRHGTNFSSLVIDRENWERGTASVLPIHDEIVRDGVPV
jgi:predicted nucleotidyltransferase